MSESIFEDSGMEVVRADITAEPIPGDDSAWMIYAAHEGVRKSLGELRRTDEGKFMLSPCAGAIGLGDAATHEPGAPIHVQGDTLEAVIGCMSLRAGLIKVRPNRVEDETMSVYADAVIQNLVGFAHRVNALPGMFKGIAEAIGERLAVHCEDGKGIADMLHKVIVETEAKHRAQREHQKAMTEHFQKRMAARAETGQSGAEVLGDMLKDMIEGTLDEIKLRNGGNKTH